MASCVAVGSYLTAVSSEVFVATESGGVWHPARQLRLPANAQGAPQPEPTSTPQDTWRQWSRPGREKFVPAAGEAGWRYGHTVRSRKSSTAVITWPSTIADLDARPGTNIA